MFYSVSRFSGLHKVLRNISYFVLWRIPDRLKYSIFNQILRRTSPYRVLRPGDTAIQIGAPWDIMKSGRSRALHFAKCVGDDGIVVVIEPVRKSIEELKRYGSILKLGSLRPVESGVWSHKDELVFLSHKDHPASNLAETVFDDSRVDLSNYDKTTIKVDSLTSLVKNFGLDSIRLLSLTTNGSDNEIFAGIDDELLSSIHYISVIEHPSKNPEYERRGFKLLRPDDRGYLLFNSSINDLA